MDKKMNEESLNLIENFAVLLFYLDYNGDITYCNKKAENMVGLKEVNIIGKNWLEILFRNASNYMKRDMFKAVLDDSSTYKRARDFRCHLLDNNKNLRLISWNITPMLDKNYQVQGSVLFGHDITEIQ
jgi:PAS domain S-box-containing protein